MAKQTATIEAVSFSRLDVYENCPKDAQFRYCKRIPEPERSAPHKRCPKNEVTGELEWHNDRGTRLHEGMDKFVRGIKQNYDPELKCLDVEMTNARVAFEQGMVLTEQMWCYKGDWEPTVWNDWDNTNMRVKLDLFWVLEGTLAEPIEAVLVDLKSGKIFGNEGKHAQQVQLYALGSFKKFPTLESVYGELWYCDHDKIKPTEYTRQQALGFQRDWDDRFEVCKSDVIFEARPSESHCKYCSYKAKEDGGTGDCEDAYRYSNPVSSPPAVATKAKKGSRSRAG